MPTYRIMIGTANYTYAQTPEEAAQKIMPGFLRLLPEDIRGEEGVWRVLSVEEYKEDFLNPQQLQASVSESEGPKGREGRE